MTGKKLIERYKSLVKGYEDEDRTDILEEMIDNAFDEIRNGFASDVVRVGIEEKNLFEAIHHLHDAQYPEVQFTEDMESMYSEAKTKTFLSIHEAVECLKAGILNYSELKERKYGKN